LLAIIVLAAVAAFIVQSNYKAIVPSPRVPHTTLVTPDTRALLVIDVPRAKDFIARNFLKDTGVPPSMLPYGLPYEAAFVGDMEYASNSIKMSLFVNDQRLAPVILKFANEAELPAPLSDWFANTVMKQEESGKIVRTGSAAIDPLVVEKIKAFWTPGKVSEPPSARGGHMLELVLDNRDGSALALICSLAPSFSKEADLLQYLNEGRLGVVEPLAVVRLQIDIAADDTLTAHLELECKPDAEASMVQIMSFALETGFYQAKPWLDKVGVKLEGKTSVQGTTAMGDYTISNLTPLLSML
jgi:hypothetical protein